MSQKHLSTGSTCPPLQRGKLRLYSMRFCPYAQRVHLVLDAKEIPYDVVYVNLSKKPEWLLEKSPLGKVPAIELEGETLYESLIISDFLDEKYPQQLLHSKDPLQKAKDKILIEHFGKVIGALFKIQYQDGRLLKEHYMHDILSGLDIFERELVNRGKAYFGGEKPGMVDYMIWPWCERVDMLKICVGEMCVLSRKRFMRLMEWQKFMKTDEAVKKTYLDPIVHAKFFTSRQAGCPDYNLVLTE